MKDLLADVLEIAKRKLSLYLISNGHAALPNVYEDILFPPGVDSVEELEKDIVRLNENIRSYLRNSLYSGELNRFEYVTRDWNTISCTAFEIALWDYVYSGVDEIWTLLGEKFLTVEFAAKVAYLSKTPALGHHSDMMAACKQLGDWFYLPADGAGSTLRQKITLDERLFGYLLGSDDQLESYAKVGNVLIAPKKWKKTSFWDDEDDDEYGDYDDDGELDPDTSEEAGELAEGASDAEDADTLVVHQALYEQLSEMVKQSKYARERVLFQLQGKVGNGRKYLITKVEHAEHHSVVWINYELLKVNELSVVRRLVWYYFRECIFYQATPVIYGLSTELLNNREEIEGMLALCVDAAPALCTRVYLVSDEQLDVSSAVSMPLQRLQVPELDREESMLLWQYYAQKAGLQASLARELISSKYRLTIDQIRRGAERLAWIEKAGQPIEEKLIDKICDEMLPAPEGGSVKRIKTQYTFDDLKLPPQHKQVLMSVCSHIWNRVKVLDHWNLKKVYSYGTGVSVLFAGPPGTGKTMAAHVIANMLGLPMYKVDLSQVVDKYVGESEKKLEQIFSIAEQSNMILFFDEADSIFGKRSEVKEANDRFANTEVSYILQRIEAYDGIVILATNFKKNIDEAFLRRMRYVVDFSMPEADTRLEIWRSCFPKEVPTAGLDLPFLAEKYEIAGGNIKNIVLNAVFLAAQEDAPVNMYHILSTLRSERQKSGSVMLPKDFYEYAEMVMEMDQQKQ